MGWRDYFNFLRPTKHIALDAGRVNVDDMVSDEPAILRPGEYTAPVQQDFRPQVETSPDRSVYGLTGTPIISGFVQDLGEYNPQLKGRTAMPVWEKMRRQDADVAATLLAMKLPIRAAEYQVVPGVNENEPNFAVAKELAKFIEDQLFGGLEYTNSNGVRVSQRFESVIEHALLALDFGCTGYEDIWGIDGNYVRLRRMAPRLPMTFYRFHTDADGETLRSVEQWGYRGNQYANVLVPANKFTLLSYKQEGSNFYGISAQRPMYQHWYLKSALYRIDSIACERNGAGIPKITMGEQPSQQDREFMLSWLRSLSVHEAQGLLLPFGWQGELMGVTGSERRVEPSIQHHSEMISRAALAMFMTLGSSKTGSRALGNTMLDFFQLAEESVARWVCDTISETTIRRLTDLNFYREGVNLPYPRLSVASITTLNPLDMITALKDIAGSDVDLLQPDDETETWFRKKTGLPMKGKPRPRGTGAPKPGEAPTAAAPIEPDKTEKKPNETEEIEPDTPNTKKGDKLEGFEELDSEETVWMAADDCSWVTVAGQHICIGKGGIVEKGRPDLVGRPIRAAVSKATYVPATKERQRLADQWESKIAKTIGATRTKDNSPFDNIKGKNAIELKTLHVSKKDRVEMRPDSRQRKEDWAKKTGMKTHTVAVDLRGAKPVIYYRKGVGAYRFGSMERVSLAQLKDKFK